MTMLIAQPLRLPNGAVLKNRLGKAPLSEGLADNRNRANDKHVRLYSQWAAGGSGLIVTGNVQVDRRYLERAGNVVLDRNHASEGEFEALQAYAKAGTANGVHLWMQINHPGRQAPRRICPEPGAPSAVPLNLPETHYAPPRAMSEAEIEDIPRRFAYTAAVARQAGFTGVQVHSAHGYLLSQFLSPLVNRREDAWGGPLENRARLLLEVVRAIRRATGREFCISVKLNSSDFQQGGFTDEECVAVVKWLGDASVDLVEISGGNYERPAMLGKGVKDSTARRESYFMEYSRAIKQAASVPVMLTGGFRTLAGMEAALAEHACDVIGLGRPVCVDPALPNALLSGQVDRAPAYEDRVVPSKLAANWFCVQLLRLGEGLGADVAMSGDEAARQFAQSEESTAASLVI